MSSDECSFVQGSVILPKRLRGVLEADEWRPLMASQLIYRKRWMLSQPWRQTLAMLLSIPLVIFGGALFAFLLGPDRFAIPWLVYVIVVVGPVFMNLVTWAQKDMRLHADAETAALLGKESFLSLLQKIDLLRLDDVEKTKKSRIMRHFSKKPSITERIETISRIDARPTASQVRTT
jgi:Zn-dependent protease with chaperone function